MRFSTSRFFHDSNPSGPLISRLKYSVLILSRYSITKLSVFAVSNTLWRRSLQCATHCGDDPHGVQHTTEIIFAVCNIPRRLSPRCASHRGDDLSAHHRDDLIDVQHTTEIYCTLQNQNSNLHLSVVAFKETTRRNPSRGEHIYSITKEKIWRNFFYLPRKFFYQDHVLHTVETTLWSNISTKSKLNSKIL